MDAGELVALLDVAHFPRSNALATLLAYKRVRIDEALSADVERMTSDALAGIIEEFRMELNDSLTAHSFATQGLSELATNIESIEGTAENPDPAIYIGVGDPNLPTSFSYAASRRSRALTQIARGGSVETRLSQQWIVYLYSIWEDYYRQRLADARECAKNDIQIPLIGDLRKLRNDVVHHRGIATQRNTGKCEVVKHWFRVGDTISLSGEQFAEFVRIFPWNELFRK